MIKEIKTFEALIAAHGQGHGCEICKPAVASILASLWNENVLEPATRRSRIPTTASSPTSSGAGCTRWSRASPAARSRRRSSSCWARSPGSTVFTPRSRAGSASTSSGAGPPLPEIWAELIAAGFESGHAYGKAVRTVKSCVGTSWCRFGVQDSVAFAIRVELRYRGLRAPHKLKGAVSGCVRECAEAQSKDFGLIATEKGYNLYVCGNGGARPRHADLLAADLDEDTALRYLDRFLMYYIRTADRLTRTSVWLEAMKGGIESLRDVVVNDRLGIAASSSAKCRRT